MATTKSKKSRLIWYFDPISPFAYLQWKDMERLPEGADPILRPVLLAGLLGHWQSKGPAEIPEKRRFTYRFAQWQAEKRGLAFRLPPAHPFNPLSVLRLCIAMDAQRQVIDSVLHFIWAEGRDPNQAGEWLELCTRLSVADPDALIGADAVKQRLRANTEEACRAGVFGVPTFVVHGEIFWGQDSMGMLLDYLSDPNLFAGGEMQRASNLPVGVQRRTAG